MGVLGATDSGRERQQYTVKGGSAGLLVQFEDLARVAENLSATSGRVRSLEQRVTDLWLEVGALAGGSGAADRARQRMLEAAHVLRNCAKAVDELAADVKESARRYAEVEGRLQLRYPTVGPASILPWFLPGRRAHGFPTLLQTETGLRSPLGDRILGGGLFLVQATQTGKPRRIEVRPLPGEPELVQVDGTAAGILARSDVLKRENRSGVVEVLRIDRDGQRTFIVTIPGTQDGVNGTSNPFDVLGNGEGQLQDSRHVSEAVAQALRLAEAEAGDAVILSGYSQGGTHAANAAAYLSEETGYSVDFLLTAGSPTGSTDLPAGLPVLHLEHTQDWVPGIDGTPNPDTPDRVTMTLNDAVLTPEGESTGLGPGHRLDNYREGAAQADASDNASLRTLLASLTASVGAGAVATRHMYRFRREPLPRTTLRPPEPIPFVRTPAPSSTLCPGPVPPVLPTGPIITPPPSTSPSTPEIVVPPAGR